MLRTLPQLKTKEDMQTALVIVLLAFIVFVKCYMVIVNFQKTDYNQVNSFSIFKNTDFKSIDYKPQQAQSEKYHSLSKNQLFRDR
ncbi:MAG: hypothetical protein ACXVBA_17535 [Mucilaginibacter sp.]